MTDPAPSHSRLFIAVRPGAALAEVVAALEPLRDAPWSAGLRWMSADKLHFTLRFLGNVLDRERDAIVAACTECAAESARFALTLAAAGAFPRPARASVLWIGVAEGAAQLTALAELLGARLAARGYPPEERPFVPHLTIARARQPLPLTAACAALATLRASGSVSALELVRSRLGGREATHEVLARCPLRE